MKLCHILLLALLAGLLPARAQQLCINEIASANLGEAIDPSWNFGGWIELYNPTSKAVNLNGLVVTDAKGHRYTLTKDHGNVPARGFRCLWFGHNDKDFPTQIDFKLDCDGGNISLLSAGGDVLDAVSYPEAVSRTSWARTTDGGETWACCSWPTPAATNAGADYASERTPDPQPTHPGGWIEGPVTFSVNAVPSSTLYYTTDGTAPGLASPRATLDASGTATFAPTANTVYRFRAVAPGCLPSAVVTRSFITRSYTKIVDNGWDWGWGDWDDWDDWGDWGTTEETTTFSGFSLLSVVTDPDYLYDDNIGIYVDGRNGGWSYWGYANYYRDWDRPVNVEIFSPEGLPLVNQEADMSMSGGYSRMNAVKSFKLKSDKKFEGVNYYPLTGLFDEKRYGRYKDVLVRSGGTTMVDRHQDNALQFVARRSGMYLDTQAFRPVYVFFNGAYQETLLLREPSNRQYGYSNYGMDTDDMDTLEESDITGVTVTHGSRDAFDQLCEVARQAGKDDAAWERVQQLLDVDVFANYFALETFLANEDWPQNNIKLFREANDAPHAGRFHVVVQDLDACFHETGNTFERLDQYEYYPYAMAGRQENVILTLFLHLLGREEFRQRFVDAFCLVAGSVFDPSAVAADLDALATLLSAGYVEKRGEMTSALSQLRSQLSQEWTRRRIKYLQSWGRARLSSARSVTAVVGVSGTEAMASGPVLVNGQPLPRGHFSGTLFLPVTLEACPLEGREFTGWMHDGRLLTTEATIALAAGGEYTAVYSNAAENATASTTVAAAAVPPVVVNEICADNAYCQSPRLKRSDWIELYNTTDADYDIEGLYVSDDEADRHKCRIDGSVTPHVIPAHGRLVLWADDHQLPFRLANADASAVVITASDDSWSNTFRYIAHGDRQSVGRWPDGGATAYVMTHPTVDAPNIVTSVCSPIVWPDVPVGIFPIVPGATHDNLDNAHAAPRYDLQGRRIDRHSAPHITIEGGKKKVK